MPETAESIPDELRLVPSSILRVVSPAAREYLEWDAVSSAATASPAVANGAASAAVLMSDSWVRRVLKPEWLPLSTKSFAVAGPASVLGYESGSSDALVKYDAVGIRYRMGGTSIQVIQSSYLLGVVVVPGDRHGGDSADFARYVISEYLQNADRILLISGRQSAYANGIGVGRPVHHPAGVWMDQWHDSFFWFTDGTTFAATCPKSAGESFVPPYIVDWFRTTNGN